MASSTLIQEPGIGTATVELDADDLGIGPQGKPYRRERVRALVSTAFGDSIEDGSAAVAPAAAAVLATIAPGAGTWEVEATVSVVGDLSDTGNVRLKKNAANLVTLANGLSPTFRKVLVGGDTVSVAVIANASPGSQYAATLVARQIA